MKTLILFFIPVFVFGTQVLTEHSHVSCEELSLKRELKIYKDPSQFVSNLGLIFSNPNKGWDELMTQNPLLTSVKGTFHLMRLGPSREFKNFGEIARLYELADPKFKPSYKEKKNNKWEVKNQKIIPIKVCGGNDAYSDSLGFVLESDLKISQIAEENENAAMPPSTLGNPIPKLKNQ